jgi:DNA polymerase elongation subunit (family B)
MHLWETINGERLYDTIHWTPYVYLRDIHGDTKTIDGITVNKMEFDTFYDHFDFCRKRFDGVYENKIKPEIQFLAERYYGIPDEDLEVPQLLTYTIDIEVHCEVGFPLAHIAEWPVVCISLVDSITKKITVFGCKPYSGNADINFIFCPTEEDLLRKFFTFMYKNPCDVITGWGIMNFDLPYLINRSNKVFGKDKRMFGLMSPVRNVRTWTSKTTGDLNIDIAGVHLLDYYHLYRWYSPKKQESYKLEFVSMKELEKGKVDYSKYQDLPTLFHENWDLYVEYNAVDSKRVDQLEEKLGYIRLIQALSLLTKVPMKYYASMTQLVEGAFLTYFRRNNLCAPAFIGGHQESFEAAYVKEPKKGMHKWVISTDIKSSYPSHIITLNMSIETYIGCIMLTEDQIINGMRKKEIQPFKMWKEEKAIEFDGEKLENFNKMINRGMIAIAPCGSVFLTGKTGVMADVERKYFFKRQEIKTKMREYKKHEDRHEELFSLQWAIKIFLNAIFGITSVPYSRYFNLNISEAITSCGRNTIKRGEFFVDSLMNNPNEELNNILEEIDKSE